MPREPATRARPRIKAVRGVSAGKTLAHGGQQPAARAAPAQAGAWHHELGASRAKHEARAETARPGRARGKQILQGGTVYNKAALIVACKDLDKVASGKHVRACIKAGRLI